MLLLDLPAELVRQVLHSLDPESFYMCLQTSKLFRAHAINSSSLLRDQLARVPGQRSIEIDTSTDADALVKVFSKRAAQHLLHGGSWLADLRVWRPTSRVDWKKCTIVPHSTLPWDYNQQNFYLTFIEVRSEDATIRIHFVEKNHTGEYRPRLQHVISSHCLPQYFPIAGEQFVRYEILKVAIYEPSIKDLEDSDELPFRQLAVLYRANLTTSICSSTLMKLIMFRLDADFGPRVVRTFDMTGSKAEEAVALAISSSCLPVILYRSYRHIDSPIARYRITTFRNEFDECTLGKHSFLKSRPTLCISPVHIFPAS
ncbi:hypothetical protein K469DRAFT_719881 [Zopfia rhizophila CBS 207.26]|uniref:F-box domain-containing protein n=1 Tax=Zopfia rhizophila CBS 207.26 TaxID=1314779 RepID=A0A6A6EJ22_9PEZI|nr:hypothetical protein K469DRAFT_719881 [Zopfia rhizophila CBS 207.26]